MTLYESTTTGYEPSTPGTSAGNNINANKSPQSSAGGGNYGGGGGGSRRASTSTEETATSSFNTLHSSSTASSSRSYQSTGGGAEAQSLQQQQQQHRRAERRVSFSGTDRVREFNLGDSERRMKIEAKRESKKTRKRQAQNTSKRRGERNDVGLSADRIVPDDDGGSDFGGDVRQPGGGATACTTSASAPAPPPPPLPTTLRRRRSASDADRISDLSSEWYSGNGEEEEQKGAGTRSSGTAGSGSGSNRSSGRRIPRVSSTEELMQQRYSYSSRPRISVTESRRSHSLDLWSSVDVGSATTSSTTCGASTASNSGTAAVRSSATSQRQRRRSSLDLWSAPKKNTTIVRRRSDFAAAAAYDTAQSTTGDRDNNNSNSRSNKNRPIDGLNQLRRMSSMSRRSVTSESSYTGTKQSGQGTGTSIRVPRRHSTTMGAAPNQDAVFTMPLKHDGPKRRSRRHSLDAMSRSLDILQDGNGDQSGNDILILHGKRMKRRTMQRRGSLEMEDEANITDVLEEDADEIVLDHGKRTRRRSTGRCRRSSVSFEDEANCTDLIDELEATAPQQQQQQQQQQCQLIPISPECRRDIIRADSERARTNRRRHSASIIPTAGWTPWDSETTFEGAGQFIIRRTKSYEDLVYANGLVRDPRCKADHTSVQTSEMDVSGCDEGVANHYNADDDSIHQTAEQSVSSSCAAIATEAASMDETGLATPPLSITIQHRRSSAGPSATTATRKLGTTNRSGHHCNRRASDSDIGASLNAESFQNMFVIKRGLSTSEEDDRGVSRKDLDVVGLRQSTELSRVESSIRRLSSHGTKRPSSSDLLEGITSKTERKSTSSRRNSTAAGKSKRRHSFGADMAFYHLQVKEGQNQRMATRVATISRKRYSLEESSRETEHSDAKAQQQEQQGGRPFRRLSSLISSLADEGVETPVVNQSSQPRLHSSWDLEAIGFAGLKSGD